MQRSSVSQHTFVRSTRFLLVPVDLCFSPFKSDCRWTDNDVEQRRWSCGVVEWSKATRTWELITWRPRGAMDWRSAPWSANVRRWSRCRKIWCKYLPELNSLRHGCIISHFRSVSHSHSRGNCVMSQCVSCPSKPPLAMNIQNYGSTQLRPEHSAKLQRRGCESSIDNSRKLFSSCARGSSMLSRRRLQI